MLRYVTGLSVYHTHLAYGNPHQRELVMAESVDTTTAVEDGKPFPLALSKVHDTDRSVYRGRSGGGVKSHKGWGMETK